MIYLTSQTKRETYIHLYILNPNSKIFQTLKTAHFRSKLVNGSILFNFMSENIV